MHRRQGFSLVELLVAMALIVFIMAIISQAFEAGVESFRIMKAQGDMQEKLRSVTTALRTDLRSDHFIGGGARLSDQDLTTTGPPPWGFVRVWHGSAPTGGTNYITEGVANSNISRRAVDHILHFTKRGDDGNWYEVAYFLRPNGASAGTSSLYALYRQELLITPAPSAQVPLVDLTVPTNRLIGMQRYSPTNAFQSAGFPTLPNQSTPSPFFTYPPFVTGPGTPAGQQTGDDLLLTDLLSFEVLILSPQALGGTQFVPLHDPSLDGYRGNNPAFYVPGNPQSQAQAVFDTWSSAAGIPNLQEDYTQWSTAGADPTLPLKVRVTALPLRIRVTALQITIRVWDDRTKQARQITIIQDM